LVFVLQFAVLLPQVGLHGSWWPTHPWNQFTELHADSTAWMLIQCKEIPDRCVTLGYSYIFSFSLV